MIKHLIFDLDGTLVDSVGITMAIAGQMLASRGAAAAVCPLTTRAHVSVGGEAMIAAVLGEHSRDPAAEIAEFRRIHAHTPTPPDTLFPHVEQILRQLADAGFILSLCSNKPQNLCEKVLRDFGIYHLFKSIVGSSEGIPRKPAPDLMQLTLRNLAADAGDCMFIGDSELDLKTSQHFNMRFVMAAWGYCDNLDCLTQSDSKFEVVPSMLALPDLVRSAYRRRAAA